MLFRRDFLTLAKAGTIQSAEIIPSTGGFLLAIYLPDRDAELLYTEKKKQREFKTLDAAYSMVSELRLTEVTLKLIA